MLRESPFKNSLIGCSTLEFDSGFHECSDTVFLPARGAVLRAILVAQSPTICQKPTTIPFLFLEGFRRIVFVKTGIPLTFLSESYQKYFFEGFHSVLYNYVKCTVSVCTYTTTHWRSYFVPTLDQN